MTYVDRGEKPTTLTEVEQEFDAWRSRAVEGYDCPGCGTTIEFNDHGHECPALRAYVARVLGKPAWEDDN